MHKFKASRSSYGAIGSYPYTNTVGPVVPPFAAGAWQRPALPPGAVVPPAGLPGPIYMTPGWHAGPGTVVHGYGAADTSEKPKYSAALIGGLLVGGALLLSVPVASSVIFGRKYGGPGYIIGFFVPGALMAGIGALSRIGK
jgi:hypothetical protein